MRSRYGPASTGQIMTGSWKLTEKSIYRNVEPV
jgi:hypothetical protein